MDVAVGAVVAVVSLGKEWRRVEQAEEMMASPQLLRELGIAVSLSWRLTTGGGGAKMGVVVRVVVVVLEE